MFEYVFGDVIPFEYFVNFLLDHNEMDIILKLSCVNRKYNNINNKILTNKYDEFVKKYEKDISKCYIYLNDNSIMRHLYVSVEYGNINMAKYIYSRYHQHNNYIYKINNMPFITACMRGYLRIAKWIYLTRKGSKDMVRNNMVVILQYSPSHIKKWLDTILSN